MIKRWDALKIYCYELKINFSDEIFIENIYACGPLAYCEASGIGIFEESQKN